MMSFVVDDLRDMLRLLEEHPEWRAELRRSLLTDDLLQLPAVMRQLAEALAGLTGRVDALAQAQERTEQRLGLLTARLEVLAARVDTLAQAQERTEQQLTLLVGEQRKARNELAGYKGTLTELRYRSRAHAYFSRLAVGLHVVEGGTISRLVAEAVRDGRIRDAEGDEIL